MVRYLFYTTGDLTYQSPLVCIGGGEWRFTVEWDSFEIAKLDVPLGENAAVTFHYLEITSVASK